MTTENRLAKPSHDQVRIHPPSDRAERQQFWIDRGNRLLWGQEGPTKGNPLTPRYDLHWVCVNGSYHLEEVRHAARENRPDVKMLAAGESLAPSQRGEGE